MNEKVVIAILIFWFAKMFVYTISTQTKFETCMTRSHDVHACLQIAR